MSPSRRIPLGMRLAVAAVPLLMAMAACGGGTVPRPAAASPRLSALLTTLGLRGVPAVGPLPAVTGPGSLHLPLDPYYLSPAEQLTIFEARRAAEQACVHRYLPGVPLGTFGMLTPLIPTTEPLAYLAPGRAAAYGYHDPAVLALAAQVAQAGPLRGTALAEANQVDAGTVPAFHGVPVPKGGCTAVGIAAVEQGISLSRIPLGTGRIGTVIGDADRIDQPVTQNDARVLAVNAKWSACMASRGYHYKSPFAALEDGRWGPGLDDSLGVIGKITAAETQVAVTDAACRAQVNLYAVYWAVAAAYQREWMASPPHMALARAQQKADQVMLARADRILHG